MQKVCECGEPMTSNEATETELIELAKVGDAEALASLVQQHQARVYRFCMKLCRDPADAEDVLQETFLALARSIGDFRGEASLSTWLYAVARSFCIKKRRRARPTASLADVTPGEEQQGAVMGLTASEPPPDEMLAGREVELAVERALRSLEPEAREVLLLRDMEGCSAAEVAEVLGISVAAVKSRLHRARLLLRERVQGLGAVEVVERPGDEQACPDVMTLYSKHLEDEVSPAVCAEMAEHVSHCERCRGACDSLKRVLGACQRQPDETPVPPRLQQSVRTALAGFLAGNRC